MSDWQPIESALKDGAANLEMPGRVAGMVVVGESLFVSCDADNPWWKFWRPRHEKILVRVDADAIGCGDHQHGIKPQQDGEER